MRTLSHYFSVFHDRNDHVGPQLLARAIHTARHGPEEVAKPAPGDLRPIISELSASTPIDEAVNIIAVEALRTAADSEDPGSIIRIVREALGWSRIEMGERLGLPVQREARNCRTLADWERGERSPGWESRKKIEALADELEI